MLFTGFPRFLKSQVTRSPASLQLRETTDKASLKQMSVSPQICLTELRGSQVQTDQEIQGSGLWLLSVRATVRQWPCSGWYHHRSPRSFSSDTCSLSSWIFCYIPRPGEVSCLQLVSKVWVNTALPPLLTERLSDPDCTSRTEWREHGMNQTIWERPEVKSYTTTSELDNSSLKV